jgi:DNA ligase D-like protein (predicted 3'-phosphoesterase)
MAHADHGKLTEYRRRRRFDRSAEPSGREPSAPGDRPVFVVQVHDASTMHFDFRLEADGVLKSWAVPKGPSADPHVKRLATPTEDHPMDYRTFEGVIEKGEYGGGTVMVWDEGTFRNLPKDRAGDEVPLGRAIENGHASFWLEGRKLHGAYALTRTRGDGRESWLLVKKTDRHAKADQHADPRRLRSALSGRTLRRIAADARDSDAAHASAGGPG